MQYIRNEVTMTVYGIGAYHGDDKDVSNTFLS